MLSDDVTRYVALYRRLGRSFAEQSRTLHLYARFAEAQGDSHVRIARIHDWCATASSPNRARTCYDAVRRLGAFLNAEDPRHELPPAGAFGRGKRPRPAPHLLEPGQIRDILRAALDLGPNGSISPYTFHYLYGLLATTGMRISEALALQAGDFGPDGLTIRHGKFGKSRLLPIHASTRAALAEYTVIRRGMRASGDDFFVLRSGRAPSKVRAHAVFVEIARNLGIRPQAPRSPGPRLHDLRHSFAVRSLEACLHDREAVAHHMAGLSTYLGHASMAHTYWYLEATPVLMHSIAAAGEQLFAEGRA
ncbi:MAG: tyrosine-type recombinase/integrase [Tabrizicola sp.]|nr:tyrosine-type recombinase/integrase [Tabrizicola sp.]